MNILEACGQQIGPGYHGTHGCYNGASFFVTSCSVFQPTCLRCNGRGVIRSDSDEETSRADVHP